MASNLELHNKLVQLVSQERRLTIEVVRHLREAERQMLFSELGYPSLFSYCVKGLGYSGAAAYRRIEAMRAIQDEPSVERKIELGVLSLSAVSFARTSIRSFERETKEKLSSEVRARIMQSVEGLSRRRAEKVDTHRLKLPERKTRYIAAAIRRPVWVRAGGQCEFVSKTTGQRCLGCSRLEIDHIHPIAMGGESSLKNLRLLCRNHNMHAAVQAFGRTKIAQTVPILK